MLINFKPGITALDFNCFTFYIIWTNEGGEVWLSDIYQTMLFWWSYMNKARQKQFIGTMN